MSLSLLADFLVGVALLVANMPFLTARFLGVFPLQRRKSLWIHAAELLVLYFVCGAVGMGMEARVGNVSSQGWEFYAITAALFLTLAFPGFVCRYMVLRDR